MSSEHMRKIITLLEQANKSIECKFTNELGNEIEISIEETTEDGQPRVKITLSGPKSVSENIITVLEATKMYSALKQYLNK